MKNPLSERKTMFNAKMTEANKLHFLVFAKYPSSNNPPIYILSYIRYQKSLHHESAVDDLIFTIYPDEKAKQGWTVVSYTYTSSYVIRAEELADIIPYLYKYNTPNEIVDELHTPNF